MRLKVSDVVNAPAEVVATIYRDYANWPNIFPTIRGVRLLGEENDVTLVEVDHVQGRVLNALSTPSPGVVELREWKRSYDALFVNRFEPLPRGSRFSVVADIAPKGIARLFAPLLRGYARRLIRRYQMQPVKAAAERCVGR